MWSWIVDALGLLWYAIKGVIMIYLLVIVLCLPIILWCELQQRYPDIFGTTYGKRKCPRCGQKELAMYFEGIPMAYPRPLSTFFRCEHCSVRLMKEAGSMKLIDASNSIYDSYYSRGPVQEWYSSAQQEQQRLRERLAGKKKH